MLLSVGGFTVVLGARDTVRLTREIDGKPAGSLGKVIGWYADGFDRALVELYGRGVQVVPLDALEVVERGEELGRSGRGERRVAP